MRQELDPAAAGDLLRWFVERGFTQHIVGSCQRPSAIVLALIGAAYIDIAHVRGADRTEAARLRNDGTANIWVPKLVVWHYYGSIVESLRGLSDLVPPGHPEAPTRRYEPPRTGTPLPLTVCKDERAQVVTRFRPGGH